mmetsp:Transcript_108369/g.171293  ORF Transcript_108369/g.171293 Transcript_108369/m.171293 type:complete len:262 (-) Transcript_108369:645-1430(-)
MLAATRTQCIAPEETALAAAWVSSSTKALMAYIALSWISPFSGHRCIRLHRVDMACVCVNAAAHSGKPLQESAIMRQICMVMESSTRLVGLFGSACSSKNLCSSRMRPGGSPAVEIASCTSAATAPPPCSHAAICVSNCNKASEDASGCSKTRRILHIHLCVGAGPPSSCSAASKICCHGYTAMWATSVRGGEVLLLSSGNNIIPRLAYSSRNDGAAISRESLPQDVSILPRASWQQTLSIMGSISIAHCKFAELKEFNGA